MMIVVKYPSLSMKILFSTWWRNVLCIECLSPSGEKTVAKRRLNYVIRCRNKEPDIGLMSIMYSTVVSVFFSRRYGADAKVPDRK